MEIIVGKKYDVDAYYIGRGTPLGNPFVMKNYSDEERNRVCDEYEVWFNKQIEDNNPKVMKELDKIMEILKRDDIIILGCFCAPKRCHGDTIKRYLMNSLGIL